MLEGDMSSKIRPSSDIRLIYHADGHPWEIHTPLKPKGEEDLYEFVDHLARSGVDVFSMMGFVAGDVVWKTDKAAFRYHKHPLYEPARLHLERLWDLGLEPIDVYARRSHERGMKYYVKFRMNDRHSGGRLPGSHRNIHMGRFIQEHQEWWLKDDPGGLDFTFAGVRDWMFNLMQEVAGKFDIDGLTLNYMRYPYVFNRAESREKQPILTSFMQRLRRMLDEEGKKKGRKLALCVIVAPTLEECHNFGLDIPTWIEEGVVDSVCPCHFDNTLFNTRYEEFTDLVKGKETLLLPAILPFISPYLYNFGYMTPPTYRAAVRNAYATGADGVSIFNYHLGWQGMETLWGAGSNNGKDSYPKTLYHLTELRYPGKLDRGDRHYVYWRCRDLAHAGEGWLDRHWVMTLDRMEGSYAEWPIRCAETFDITEKSLLRLNAVNLLPGDEVEISINGKVIPHGNIARTFNPKGRTNIQEGMKLPPYTTVTFAPTAPPFVFLDNILGMKLVKSAVGASGEISVPEIEIAISASNGDPMEIMNLMIDGPYPEPLKTLAGFHPSTSQISSWIMDGDYVDGEYIGGRIKMNGKEGITMGAQSFVLEDAKSVSSADICVYRIPEIQEALCLSLRADNNGVPADEPVSMDAVASLDPWENSEDLLIYLLQGYYKFSFKKPVVLKPGVYWLVLEMDPSKQPESSLRWGDPAQPSCYTLALAKSAWEHYPKGHYMTWTGSKWRQAKKDDKPVSAYFGIFESCSL